jgi:uncharacterized membrane protein YdjX (TVP38/TMEM64 family)
VKARPAARWTLLAIAVAAILAAGHALPLVRWITAFGAWISGLGPAGIALYVAAYAIVAVLLLPAWLMTIGAGFLFGLLPGVGIVSAGSTAGAAASFLIARGLARDRVARKAAGNPKFAALDREIGKKGWRIVFLLRLSAVVPYVWSNYAYGLTSIRFWPYLAASWAGMIPLTFLYVSLGVAARKAGGIGDATPPGPWGIAVFAAGLLLTAGVTFWVTRLTRRALATGASGTKPY